MKSELSVAIIFKDEIRCIERCLKSLEPLKKAVSCEIVMADTGSTDGSREVAERYADLLFDFPWINDFAAARNAVLDRCSGKWVLVMDCDEWLDEDISELTIFLRGRGAQMCTSAQVVVRNYTAAGFSQYGDVSVRRMMRLSAHPRYEGAIHETPVFSGKNVATVLSHTMLHHDGYVMLNDGSAAGEAKRARNLALLETELEKTPDDPNRLKQYLEAAGEKSDLPVLRHAVELAVAPPTPLWKKAAPAILGTAIFLGYAKKLWETEEWIQKAQELYPESYFTRMDVAYLRTMHAIKTEDFAAAISLGEELMATYAEADRDAEGINETIQIGVLQRYSPHYKQLLRQGMVESYQHLGRFEKIPPLLEEMDWTSFGEKETHDTLWLLMKVYIASGDDLTALMSAFWAGICEEKPDKEAAERRKKEFLENARIISNARSKNNTGREPWQMFLPLRGKCPAGDEAALMGAASAEEADALLASYGDLSALSSRALVHALDLGAAFPIPGRLLTLEEADTLAHRLMEEKEELRALAILSASSTQSDQEILWARGLALAALQVNDWEADANPWKLVQAFVRIESAFLPRCYSENALRQSEYLPPMHRFALHLANAFAVLAPQTVAPDFTPTVTGGVHAALSELKEAVKAAPEQKKIVDLILDDISKGI